MTVSFDRRYGHDTVEYMDENDNSKLSRQQQQASEVQRNNSPILSCGRMYVSDHSDNSMGETESETKSSNSLASFLCDDSDDSIEGEEYADLSFSGEAAVLLLPLQELEIPSECPVHDTCTQTPNEVVVDAAPYSDKEMSFRTLHITYLLVTLVVMLADGLQGTHLYVLYEGYGFSVASLYCLGFVTGGLASPITGPLVDRIGRKRSAILYCALEMFINWLEQYPFIYGLILSRMIGGITTNLLSSVFETWLDTEYRKRGFEKEKYEIILRDSVIVSNLAAILSGYLAHALAEQYGAVGPFQGAVTCTAIALVVVCFIWTENYGSSDDESKHAIDYFKEAIVAFKEDSKMRCVGFLQGLTAGCVQIFVFLWAPTLRHLAQSAPEGSWGLDKDGEPAYGLIFGAFMSAGVIGGLIAPSVRRFVTSVLTPIGDSKDSVKTIETEEGQIVVRPMAVEFLASTCYFLSAALLFVPYYVSENESTSFSLSLGALLVFELLIGIFLPCEGVIRSLYFPTDARASIMTLPRIIVNVAVALGVVSTNYIELKTTFFIVASLMVLSGCLQISLVSAREWTSLFSKVEKESRRVSGTIFDLYRRNSKDLSSMSSKLQKLKEI